MEQHLQVDEVKWRFLVYQLEHRQIIKDDVFEIAPERWDAVISEIIAFCRNRYLNKQKELWKLVNWIEETTCLRIGLYRHFQENVQKKQENCCSNCGFTMKIPVETTEWETVPDAPAMDWQKELRLLLLEGAEK